MANVLDLLKGRKVKVMTDMKVEVELEIKEAKDSSWYEDIGSSNRSNDWWPDQLHHPKFTVYFTNGAVKDYQSINEIELL